MAQHTKNRKRTPDEIREQFQRMCDTRDASYICEAISEVAAQLCEQNAIAEKVAIEAKRINDHILNRDSIIEVKVRGGDAMVRGEQPEATMAPAWYSVDVKPERAGWYNVWREMDGHRSVRCWDDSAEAWFYVGDRHKVFVPNNSFTHWSELPRPHLSRLSSEAIESASKEAVGRDLEPHFVAWAKRLAYLTMSDMNEPTSDPEFQQRVKFFDGELRMFLSAIEKARSK